MPYIYRDKGTNKINGHSRNKCFDGHEFIAGDSDEWVQHKFDVQASKEAEALRQSELDIEFNSAGIKGKTKEQIKTKINTLVNPSETVEKQIAGLKTIILKMAMKMAK